MELSPEMRQLFGDEEGFAAAVAAAQESLKDMPTKEQSDRFYGGTAHPLVHTTGAPPEAGSWDRFGRPDEEAAKTAAWVAVRNAAVRRALPASEPLPVWIDRGMGKRMWEGWDRDELFTASLLPRSGTDPTIRPGDIVTVRRQATIAAFEWNANAAHRALDLTAYVESAAVPLAVYDAMPHHVPGPVAAALVSSSGPDRELVERLRLPFPSVLVAFSEPIMFPGSDPEQSTGWMVMADEDTRSEGTGDGGLVAVHLTAGPDGTGLDPYVTWILAADGGYTAVPALWERSEWTEAVINTAALLTWGDWNQPPPDPPQLTGTAGSREWRRSLKRSAVRRSLTHGGVTGVRTLNLDRALRAQPSDDSTADADGSAADRSAPIAHWRRGHWHRYRIATRDERGAIIGSTTGVQDIDWSYAGRWIPPTVVNPSGPADPGVKIYTTTQPLGGH